jgi:hypothetical protein
MGTGQNHQSETNMMLKYQQWPNFGHIGTYVGVAITYVRMGQSM